MTRGYLKYQWFFSFIGINGEKRLYEYISRLHIQKEKKTWCHLVIHLLSCISLFDEFAKIQKVSVINK